MEKVNFR